MKAYFCSRCGEPLKKEDGVFLCPYCGAIYKDENETDSRQKRIQERASPRRKKKEEAEEMVKEQRFQKAVTAPILDGGYLSYGEYPQSKVIDPEILARLQEAALKPTYGLYLSLEGKRYAKYKGEWFQVTPITWLILHKEGKECLVTSKELLDARRYDPENADYANSELRKWLHEHFLSHAFPNPEYLLKLHLGLNGKDEIALLREADVLNPNYGFREDRDRVCSLSDYAACRVDLKGEDSYWLRPEKKSKGKEVPIVLESGAIGVLDSANPLVGIRPILKIRLP